MSTTIKRGSVAGFRLGKVRAFAPMLGFLAGPIALLLLVAVALLALACSAPPTERREPIASVKAPAIVDDAAHPEDLTPEHQALLLDVQLKNGGGFETLYLAAYLRQYVLTQGYRGKEDLARAAARGLGELHQFAPDATRLSGNQVDALKYALGAAGTVGGALTGGLGPLAFGLGAQTLSYMGTAIGRTPDYKGQGDALLSQGRYAGNLFLMTDTVYASILKLSEKDPQGFAEGIDDVLFKPRFGGVSTKDSIAILRSKDLSLDRNLVLGQVVRDLELHIKPSLEQARFLAEQNRATLEDVVQQLQQHEVDASQARAYQEKIDFARTASRGIAMLIAKDNPQAAAKVAFLGGAAVTVVDTLLRLKSTNPLLQISKLAAFNGFVGIALTAFDMFGKQSAPDPWLVQELQAIRALLVAGFEEMRQSFSHLEHRLDDLERLLGDGFAEIRAEIAGVNSEVEQVARAVVDLADQIRGLEAGLFEYLSAGFARPYLDLVDLCAGYQARTGFEMSQERFSSCESGFFTEAITHSADFVLAGADCSNTDQATLTDALSAGPPARNLRCALTFLQKLGVTGLRTQNAANSRSFDLAANMYASLLSDDPAHAERLAASRIDTLLGFGQDVRATIVGLTLVGQGAATAPNRQLWNKAFEYRTARRSELGQELTAVEGQVQNTLPTWARPLSLFAGPDLAPPSAPSFTGMGPCTGTGATLSVPQVIGGLSSTLRLAGYLGDGLEICYRDLAWGGTTRTQFMCPGNFVYSRLLYTIEVRRGAQAVARSSRVGPELQSGTSCGCCGPWGCASCGNNSTLTFDPATVFVNNWTKVKADFEAAPWVEALATADKQAAEDAARAFNVTELRGLQNQLYLQAIEEVQKPTVARDRVLRSLGADDLVRNLVHIGLFDELESNEPLHAAMEGSGVLRYTPDEVIAGYRAVASDSSRDITVRASQTLTAAMTSQATMQETAINDALAGRAQAARTAPAPVGALDINLGHVFALQSGYEPFLVEAGSTRTASTPLARIEFREVLPNGSGQAHIVATDPPILQHRPDQAIVQRAYLLDTTAIYEGASVCLKATRAPAPGEKYVIVGGTDWVRLQTESRDLMDASWTCSTELEQLPGNVGLAVARNQPPLAVCRDVRVEIDEGERASVDASRVAATSIDPDQDTLTFTLTPSGPFTAGEHGVTATVSDGADESTCRARVLVVVRRGAGGEGGIDDGTGTGGSARGGSAGESPGSGGDDSGEPGRGGTDPVGGSGGSGETPTPSQSSSQVITINVPKGCSMTSKRPTAAWQMLLGLSSLGIALAIRRRRSHR